jgi:NADPH2:quinone reductase
MTLVMRLEGLGGAEMLRPAEIELGRPGPGEARIRHTGAGVNYVDIYHRTGLYPLAGLPAVLGVEGAGVVEDLGEGVSGLSVGDYVAWAGLPVGGYAQARLIPADRLIKLPKSVPERTVAAAMLRGITAHMLLRRVWPVAAGNVVLIHAAAGGLGLLLAQWAKRLGAVVIGAVGDARKADLARRHGVDHTVLYREIDFVKVVRELTGGRGADVAYDGVGGETLARTLDAVRPFGMVASVGQASGALPDINLADLGPRRSLSLARPSVFAYAADQTSYRAAAAEFIDQIENGLKINIGAEYPLTEAAEAHRALEAARTTGSVLLTF